MPSIHDIQNSEHDEENNAKRVVVVDGEASSSAFVTNIQTDSVDSNITYIGKATTGSATSAAVWQIQKIDETTGTVIQWADGNLNFDNIFDNRQSLTYS